MALIQQIGARVRGFFAPNYAEQDEDKPFGMNPRGDQLIAQSLPPMTELVRLGNSWQAITTTGLAAATAMPTTTSGFSLVNGEKAGGLTYVIDSFGSFEVVVDATQTDVTAIVAMLNKITSAAASAGTAETSQTSLSGRKNYAGNSSLIRGATVVNDVWFPHATSGQMAAAVAGANFKVNEVPVNGLYLVQPGSSFSIAAIKAAAAAALQQFYYIRWHEVQLSVKNS